MREACKIEQEGKESGKKRPPLRSRLWAWTGFADKTLWEWLQLLGALAIPVVLAIAGFWFTSQQEARQQRIEDQRAQQAQKIENQRAEAERELAEQRAQDEALQAYLDQMGSLLLERDLRASEEDSEVRSLARARTLTVLSRLDPNRKTALMQFLVEADLVQRVNGRDPIISLLGANLRGADLSDADLSGAVLLYADLSDANLSRAELYDAVLISADLRGADLSDADLYDAIMIGTDLPNADLSDADLSDADLPNADLPNADLPNAYLPNANLSGADLSDADLSGADLNGADLRDPILRDANLSNANLSNAKGVTGEQLEEQAKTLERATMPDGQKYEDWLKSKGRGETTENSGSS